jgi:hypothetical protein
MFTEKVPYREKVRLRVAPSHFEVKVAAKAVEEAVLLVGGPLMKYPAPEILTTRRSSVREPH